jgi:hypothetical protein
MAELLLLIGAQAVCGYLSSCQDMVPPVAFAPSHRHLHSRLLGSKFLARVVGGGFEQCQQVRKLDRRSTRRIAVGLRRGDSLLETDYCSYGLCTPTHFPVNQNSPLSTAATAACGSCSGCHSSRLPKTCSSHFRDLSLSICGRETKHSSLLALHRPPLPPLGRFHHSLGRVLPRAEAVACAIVPNCPKHMP